MSMRVAGNPDSWSVRTVSNASGKLISRVGFVANSAAIAPSPPARRIASFSTASTPNAARRTAVAAMLLAAARFIGFTSPPSDDTRSRSLASCFWLAIRMSSNGSAPCALASSTCSDIDLVSVSCCANAGPPNASINAVIITVATIRFSMCLPLRFLNRKRSHNSVSCPPLSHRLSARRVTASEPNRCRLPPRGSIRRKIRDRGRIAASSVMTDFIPLSV